MAVSEVLKEEFHKLCNETFLQTSLYNVGLLWEDETSVKVDRLLHIDDL
jgi:hypothetical protein